MKLVERLKQENEEIDYSLQQARERLTNVKVKKQRQTQKKCKRRS